MTTKITFNRKGQETSRSKVIEREIEKALVVSTAHLSKDEVDDLTLSEYTMNPYPVAAYDYGCYVYLGDPAEDEDKLKSMSLEFARLVEIAREQGCSHIKLDRDGPTYEDLPTFDW